MAASDLPCTVGKVIHNYDMTKISETMDKYFQHFGTISDATPVDAETDSFKV